MKRIAIIEGVRTPFIKFGTLFNDIPAYELARIAVKELLYISEIDPELVDELILGNVAQPADTANIARVVQLACSLNPHKTAYTVHRNCASGIEAVTSGAEKIEAGVDNIVIAGGTESMSNIPFLFSKDFQNLMASLNKAKTFWAKLNIIFKFRPKHFSPIIGLLLGLTDPVCGQVMGLTAENLVREFGLTRQEQDEFALQSHQKATKGKNKRKEEIVPIYIPPGYKEVVDDDNGYRENQTLEALAQLKPYFDRRNGTITVGNASQVTDGACAVLLMEDKKAQELGLEVLGYIRAYGYAGVEPHRMGLGPAYAIPLVLKRVSLKLKDIELIEINEAFAAQVIACERLLKSKDFAQKYFGETEAIGEINREILNVNGGAIALGHPVGSTGTRLILTVLKEMKRRNLNLGLASLCVGGGQGGAIILER